jgi:alpha-D-ribose 1-methylphosphonate 5-phosphate C-P lyase
MAWTNSKMFRAYIKDIVTNVTAMDLDTDASIKVALYNTTTTPDQDVASASSAFNTGVWVTANEISQTVTWPTGGVALTTPVVTSTTAATVFFDAADTASGASATLAAFFGCLVYDDTITTPVADQGICFNYFGGTQTVTNGVATVVWHANGIWRITL